jgi:fucose permease
MIGLLDEVLVAFAAVHLAALSPGPASIVWRQATLGALIVGGVVGLVALERVVEDARAGRVLQLACVLALLSSVALALAPDLLIASVALFVLGASSAVLHPLVKARAYASLPGRPLLVNAVAAALVPLDALAPLVLGAIAFGTEPRIAMLVLVLARRAK